MYIYPISRWFIFPVFPRGLVLTCIRPLGRRKTPWVDRNRPSRHLHCIGIPCPLVGHRSQNPGVSNISSFSIFTYMYIYISIYYVLQSYTYTSALTIQIERNEEERGWKDERMKASISLQSMIYLNTCFYVPRVDVKFQDSYAFSSKNRLVRTYFTSFNHLKNF